MHVGDEDLLTARFGLLDDHVDRFRGQCGTQGSRGIGGVSLLRQG